MKVTFSEISKAFSDVFLNQSIYYGLTVGFCLAAYFNTKNNSFLVVLVLSLLGIFSYFYNNFFSPEVRKMLREESKKNNLEES